MAIHHVVTIRVAKGRAAAFAAAFAPLRAAVLTEDGCLQYELFQSLDDPDRLVILEAWADQVRLDRHMAAERDGDPALLNAIIALWEPGTTPTVARYET
jgi:quinol monooxygenase YgiN